MGGQRRRRITEKEKNENIWRMKIYSLQMRRKTEKAENFWRRNFFCEDKEKGEGKGRRYLEKENVIFVEEKKTEKEIEENIWRRIIFFCGEKRKRRRIFGE